MDITLSPSPLRGAVPAVPSKSDSHRNLICSALSQGETLLSPSSASQDIAVTMDCLSALGASILVAGPQIRVAPGPCLGRPLLFCGESGTTLRFLLPVAAALADCADFRGSARLSTRPISHLIAAMERRGVRFSGGSLPFCVSGRLTAGQFRVPGDVSSQYISGLLLALPLLSGDSEISLSTPLESRGYVDMTLSALSRFSVAAEAFDGGWRIPGGQSYRSPGVIALEGEWSNAAFFLCAGAVSGPVTVTGLRMDSLQGDKAVLEVLRYMGASVSVSGDAATVAPGELRGREIDLRQIPDLFPPLAVAAASAAGETRFVGASRLRTKESDRLSSTAALLRSLGIRVTEGADTVSVFGGKLTGGTVDSFGDHRIAMAAAIAAPACASPLVIRVGEAVRKSYPNFFEHYEALGGSVLRERR